VDRIRTVEDRTNFIRRALKQFAENDGLQAGIWHKGRLAGVVGCHSIDWQNRSTTLGYWLGEGFQGKGIMTEACRAMVNHAFRELGLNRGWASRARPRTTGAGRSLRGWVSGKRACKAKPSGFTTASSTALSTPCLRVSGEGTPRVGLWRSGERKEGVRPVEQGRPRRQPHPPPEPRP